jgi:hypothetical protein
MEDSFFDGKRGRLRGSKVLTVEETGMENTLYADGRTPGRREENDTLVASTDASIENSWNAGRWCNETNISLSIL